LLSNPVVKLGDSSKLTPKFTSMFSIEKVLPGFNYLLKDVTSGKTLQRPVHAQRLRLYRARDEEILRNDSEVCLFDTKTKKCQIAVKIVVGDLISCNSDVLVNQYKKLSSLQRMLMTKNDTSKTANMKWDGSV
jgi:hypothetical protein